MRFTPEHATRANALRPGTLVEHLGITYHVDGDGNMCATMPVEARTHQPMGLLHGGATAALAESLGSMASALIVDLERQAVVGIEVAANHLKGVRSGLVTATGEIIHLGRTTHVWDIRVRDEQGALVAVCRLTNLVIERR
ncbi:MAG: hotdog fold thioesterase [Flavobacteriales bacterium]|nr:hotdog fold thioesterase [Flavobacteriales bacterium]